MPESRKGSYSSYELHVGLKCVCVCVCVCCLRAKAQSLKLPTKDKIVQEKWKWSNSKRSLLVNEELALLAQSHKPKGKEESDNMQSKLIWTVWRFWCLSQQYFSHINVLPSNGVRTQDVWRCHLIKRFKQLRFRHPGIYYPSSRVPAVGVFHSANFKDI